MTGLIREIVVTLLSKITFASYLVVVCSIGFFGLLLLSMFHEVPKDNQTVVFALIGSVGGYVTAIVQFKFGSSASSQKKDDALMSGTK